ncbi:hypothetical protein [Arenicella xantha]|uniref:Outer membrane beta-barrel porin/alpha-amylase n=1 Tax=Arenicella xantha TaxID=644221 RepID=A0A395JI26_9GAMM|nr:hypothetical protein [Arenicella xantha]RBP49675.1 hypothetical protein DFR28_103100 [Arenicella xantha]
MKWLVALLMLMTCYSSAACPALDPTLSGELAMNLPDAEQQLTNVLLATQSSDTLPQQTTQSIDCWLAQQSEFYTPLATIRPALTRLSTAAEIGVGHARTSVINEINRSITRDAGTGFIQFPVANGGTTTINLYDDLVTPFCQAHATTDCARATQLAQQLWLIAGYYRALSDSLNRPDKLASLQFNQTLEQQWQSYKDDTIKLWPHEVLVNSLIYQPQKTGLSGPPNYKLLALRPTLGLSYLSDQPHRIQPTINVDLLGIYWWKYSESGNDAASPGRGIAASLVWDGDDTAYGLTYHHNPKWSVSVAHGDENDIVLSVSLQLAYWVLR